MRAEVSRRVIAEWLEEQRIPPLIRRDTPAPDLGRMSEILAVVGPRRAGKTYFMYQLIGDLIDSGACQKDDILFVDFEDYRLVDFSPGDMDGLFTAFTQLTGKSPGYAFFDEVQHLPSWSRVLRTLHNRGSLKIVVSGSNSELLGREIATELRGRYQDLLMLPFSFRELLRLKGLEYSEATFHTAARGRILAAFDEYLKGGGFPEVAAKEHVTEKRQLLQNYYRTVFYRDTIDRYNIKARHLLEAMMRYCLDTYSDLFSISSFEKHLKASGTPGSKRTISNYLQYMADAFFLILTEKYSYSPRKRVMNPKKVYLLDTGFTFLATEFSENRGKALENVVAVELLRRQEQIFYHMGRGECDFVVIPQTGKGGAAIQVCWQLTERTRARELNGLLEAAGAWNLDTLLVLTYDEELQLSHHDRTVSVLPVWKWLLQVE